VTLAKKKPWYILLAIVDLSSAVLGTTYLQVIDMLVTQISNQASLAAFRRSGSIVSVVTMVAVLRGKCHVQLQSDSPERGCLGMT
jgi:hypothetical protein